MFDAPLLVGGAVLSLCFLYGSVIVKLLSVLIAIFAWKQWKRPEGLPPGPRGLPFVGYIPFIFGRRYILFNKLAKKYGQMYSLYLGKNLTVIMNDYAHIRAALVDNADVFAGRPALMRKRTDGKEAKSLISHDGPIWREHRRFALSTLREFGIGKSSIEPALQNEIQYFLQAINDRQGKSFDIGDLLGMSLCNNICILEYGKRFEYEDEYFLQLKHAVDVLVTRNASSTSLYGLIRYYLMRLPFYKSRDIISNSNLKLEDFSKQIAEEHRQGFQPGSKNDYIDAYYTEKAQRERTNNQAELFDDDSLIDNLNLLFLAGTETSTTTLRWALLFMLMHPDIQRKVQQEIDDVVGRQRSPSVNDRLQMPYTEATLLEVSRRGSIVPTNVVHSTLEDIDFEGYHLPKDTMILTNLWAVHHDEKLFPDPFSFRPERFINERGQFVKHEAVIPFSLGKRFCLGEPLARMELFLYFTSMLQKFTFVNPEGQGLSDETMGTGVNTPYPFNLQAMPRED